jgi:hypothetical protein
LWCWYVRRASGFCGVIGMSLIGRRDYGKTRMRGRKKNFKCYTYMCTHVHTSTVNLFVACTGIGEFQMALLAIRECTTLRWKYARNGVG